MTPGIPQGPSNTSNPFRVLSIATGLLALLLAGSGCGSAQKVRERLRVELAQPTDLIGSWTNTSGRMSFAEAGARWAERDPETMHHVTRALSENIDVAEAKSWVWPRADVEFQEKAALERNGDSVRSFPSGGLVLRYDLKKMFFRSDAAAVSQAGRDLNLEKARLAIDGALGRLADLILDWQLLRETVPLEEKRAGEFSRLLKAMDTLDQLGALPPGSFAEWKHRAQVAQREQAETVRRLESVRQSLRTGLGLAGGPELDLGNLDFLLNVPALPDQSAGEGEARRWLPEVWRSHPTCRVVELELFQAEMGMVAAKRERLPRLSGSISVGEFDTFVGTDAVEARSVAAVGVSMPLFDAGTISRGVEKAQLRRDLARRNLGMAAQHLTREAQSAAVALRTAHDQSEHRQGELEEVRRLAELAGRGAELGQGDPLLPFALRIYRVEAELGVAQAKARLAKTWRAYRAALGEQPAPGMSSSILEELVRSLGKNKLAAKK